MDKKLIEEQAERVTNLFSYRSGYSTPKDAFMEGAKFVLNQVQDEIDKLMKRELDKVETYTMTVLKELKDCIDIK